jgi:hypothetical protein
VYIQIIWNALREPTQRALEALVMERQAEGEATPVRQSEKLPERMKARADLEGPVAPLQLQLAEAQQMYTW